MTAPGDVWGSALRCRLWQPGMNDGPPVHQPECGWAWWASHTTVCCTDAKWMDDTIWVNWLPFKTEQWVKKASRGVITYHRSQTTTRCAALSERPVWVYAGTVRTRECVMSCVGFSSSLPGWLRDESQLGLQLSDRSETILSYFTSKLSSGTPRVHVKEEPLDYADAAKFSVSWTEAEKGIWKGQMSRRRKEKMTIRSKKGDKCFTRKLLAPSL